MFARLLSAGLSTVIFLSISWRGATGVGLEPAEAIPQDEIPKLLGDIKREWSRDVQRNKYVSAWRLGSEVSVERGGEESRIIVEVQYKSCGDEFVLVKDIEKVRSDQQGTAPSPPVVVRCRNHKYYFELQAMQPDGPYRLVRYLRIKPNDRTLDGDLLILNFCAREFVYPAMRAGNIPLLEGLDDGTFKVVAAHRDVQDGRNLLVLTIQADSTPGPSVRRLSRNAVPFLPYYYDEQTERYLPFTVTVEPDERYRVVRIEGVRRVFVRDKNEFRTYKRLDLIGYEPNQDGRPRIIQTTIERPNGTTVHTSEYRDWSKQAPDRSEFYLTAFGLPEPVDLQTRQGRSLFWWLAAAGLTCIVIGFGLWRWYEWHQQKNKPA
jgi:hypothetical protein